MDERGCDTENVAPPVIGWCGNPNSVIGQTIDVTFEAGSAQIGSNLELDTFNTQIEVKIENIIDEGIIEQSEIAQEYGPLHLIVPKSEKTSANGLTEETTTARDNVYIEITKAVNTLKNGLTKDNKFKFESISQIETSLEKGLISTEKINTNIHDNTVSTVECCFCDFAGSSKESQFQSNLKQYIAREERKPYQCSYCNKGKIIVKERIRKLCTKSDKVKAYTCAHCECKLSTKSALIQHLRQHAVEKPYKCHLCDSTFKVCYNLKQHISNIHEKVYKCPLCDFSCKINDDLRNHCKDEHSDVDSYKCTHCDLKFKDELYLTHHMAVHNVENPHKCRLCKYGGRSDADLEQHITNTHATSDDVKPYGCAHCGLKFSSKYNLIPHVRIHTGEKPYKCQFCDYASSSKGNLKLHTRTHTGEKPFKCSYCDYTCVGRSSLTKHVRTHTSEKPYNCPLCDYACNNRYSLKVHVRIHTGEKPFKCQFCDYSSCTNMRLKAHMRIHTDEKPYKCQICDYACRNCSNLKRHVKRSHLK